MSANAPYPGTQAVLRAIALLKAFSEARPELSLTELARATHLKKTTAFRLLTALESEGMLVREARSEAYRLGPEFLALGARALRSNDLRSASREHLEWLAQETREMASLEILAGKDILILDEVPGSYLVGSTPSIGTRWPAHATSTGKVLLANLPEAQLLEILTQPLAKITSRTINDPARLRQELEIVRQQGYATATGELEAGYVAIGAPIQDIRGRVVAAASAGGPATRLSPQRVAEVAPLVKQCAHRISESLGFVT